MEYDGFFRISLCLAMFISIQRLAAPLSDCVGFLVCVFFSPSLCCLKTQKSRWGKEVEALIDKPPCWINVTPRWVVNGEVTSSSLEHILAYLCTTKSILSISSLPFNCSQLEHVAFWHGRARVTHTHAWRCSRCAHAVALRSDSFQSHESRGLSLSISPVRSVNLTLTFEQIWCDTPKMLCACAPLSLSFSCSVCVCLWDSVKKRRRISKMNHHSHIQCKQWSWLVKGEHCLRTPQWGIYYSNYQRNVLLISYIYLFFPCFDRNS